MSYSDLLLSIATAQWERLDARSEIHLLVDELNTTKDSFNFSKDFVLKAGLMLCDIASVGFKVENFNQNNMESLEHNWRKIADVLKMSVRLVADFGFSGRTLTADSALLPVAYYLHRRGLDARYLTASGDFEDREQLRHWLIRSLLKAGVWGSGLDTLLTAIRATIKEHGAGQFPVDAIEAAMQRRGRSLRFDKDEIEDLAEVAYPDKRVFSLLTLLYPFVDLRNEFHIDHVFPRSRFTPAQLAKAGIQEDEIDWYRDHADRLANLQLLEGPINKAKQDQLPFAWLDQRFQEHERRSDYLDRNDLRGLPEQLSGFGDFYLARREQMANKLVTVLGK